MAGSSLLSQHDSSQNQAGKCGLKQLLSVHAAFGAVNAVKSFTPYTLMLITSAWCHPL